MTSLFTELNDRIAADPRLNRRGGPRVDLSMLLFNARDDIEALWDAATQVLDAESSESEHAVRLQAAVESLRPIFGDRER